MDITPEIQAVIDSAIAEAVAGLKAKNSELLDKNKKLMKNQEIDPQTVVDLEKQIEQLQADLTASQKVSKDSVKTIDTLTKQLQSETGFTQKLLIDNGLTESLVKNGIAPQFLPAVKAMFSGQAQIVADGESRTARIGDKALNDYVKEWAASDEGKHFVIAPANSGGGSHGGTGGNTGTKTMSRSQFDASSQADRASFVKSGGTVIDDS